MNTDTVKKPNIVLEQKIDLKLAKVLITTIPFGEKNRLPFELLENAGIEYLINPFNKKIKEIHKKYSDIINYSLDKSQRKSPGELLALFNSSGYVEIAIYKSDLNTVGGASTLLGLDYRDTVIINFT